MSIATLQGATVPIKLWTPVHDVEAQALAQLKNIAALPWVFHHVAVMPDVHFGKGATVGSVIAMKDAVSPAAVGVDIGCGMAALKTSLTASDLPESLRDLRSHGAGRKMSRHAAKRHFSVKDLAAQTQGVECRKDAGVLDEIPGCYKDIDEVIRQQADLVDVRFELKQVLCVKG